MSDIRVGDIVTFGMEVMHVVEVEGTRVRVERRWMSLYFNPAVPLDVNWFDMDTVTVVGRLSWGE